LFCKFTDSIQEHYLWSTYHCLSFQMDLDNCSNCTYKIPSLTPMSCSACHSFPIADRPFFVHL
jgi:hypothetical protein